MIRRLEISNYKVVRRVSVDLDAFQVLVGPNGSGKSTVMDALVFLSDILHDGVESAVLSRAETLRQLSWRMQGGPVQFALELQFPEKNSKTKYKACRYEISIAAENDGRGIYVEAENLFLLPKLQVRPPRQSTLFPTERDSFGSLIHSRAESGWRTVFRKTTDKRYDYHSEVSKWHFPYEVIRDTTGLRSMPGDERRFPTSLALRRLLGEGIRFVQLDVRRMRKPCPPTARDNLEPDGSNFARAVFSLMHDHSDRFRQWSSHVLGFLPEFKKLGVREKEEDRSLVLELETTTGTVVPVWLLSDGTIRFIALTLIAYLPEESGIFLIEEPENGIHPSALDGVHQALSSSYDRQLLVATHSPLFVSATKPEQLLCFGKTDSGTVDVVRGTEHPMLKDWRRTVSLGTLYAAGVLD